MPLSLSKLSSRIALILTAFLFLRLSLLGAESDTWNQLDTRYQTEIYPLLDQYCFDCHEGEDAEADLDLATLPNLDTIRSNPSVWIQVEDLLSSRQMPPKKSEQPRDPERERLVTWVEDYLTSEAESQAGDPGRVVLRRLNNAEYTYTVRDLTGLPTLDPVKTFPVDGAAGEGFTNTGDSLSTSPALIQKYLDASKSITAHAVLHPKGLRFSPTVTRRDWTDELLDQIRSFYARYTANGGGQSVNLQGIQFDTNQGGVLPIADYLQACLTLKDAPNQTLEDLAQERRLNERYLRLLWNSLHSRAEASIHTLLLDRLRSHFRMQTGALPFIESWQKVLWRFTSIGHIGREGGPEGWLVPVDPIVSEQTFELELPDTQNGAPLVLYLNATDAGDGNREDWVQWEKPRLTGGGLPDLPLADLTAVVQHLRASQTQALAQTQDYLRAAARAQTIPHPDPQELARLFGVDPNLLAAWLVYLDLSTSGPVTVTDHFSTRIPSAGDYDFIQGWGSQDTPSILANPTDQSVRIPGLASPHSVFVHPSPTHYSAIGWQSPMDGPIRITGSLKDAHPECGNGVSWWLVHRTAGKAVIVAQGTASGRDGIAIPAKEIGIRAGEVVSLIIGPRDGNHGCDLTQVSFQIKASGNQQRAWDLAREVSPDILRGNPQADAFGHPAVWHFYTGEVAALRSLQERTLRPPAGSSIASWLEADTESDRSTLAKNIVAVATGERAPPAGSPDSLMLQHLKTLAIPQQPLTSGQPSIGDPRFGPHGSDQSVPPTDLVHQAPSVLEFEIPPSLAKNRKFVASARLRNARSQHASIQVTVGFEPPSHRDLLSEAPLILNPDSLARSEWQDALDSFRELLPPVLCYSRIVPVDEVVTLTLFYREDTHLQRLMLSEAERAELDALWDELLYVSREPLQLVVAYEQLTEFATQDRPDLVEAWKPAKKPIHDRAEAFRHRLVATEPIHLQAVIDFAHQAYRRPLSEAEANDLRRLYHRLREEDLEHEPAIRLLVAKILTAPSFLFRLEEPGPAAEPVPVTQRQLATRLSYFLWSSLPDEALRHTAETGSLAQTSTLEAQTRRLLADPRIRRLAVEFACQWLLVRDFDTNNEKNETLYPNFTELRGDMYEETIRFFTDLFQNDGSVLDILSADYAFVNAPLATHYGLPSPADGDWQKVSLAEDHPRGGILAMASILAKQSGASRTSPILRGNWVSETLLGEHLPNPPLDVPVLPDAVPSGLTARELIEQHSADPACAKCHARIDPYGFALEGFDALGRRRSAPPSTLGQLPDGTSVDGIQGLRTYLADGRRADFLDQFCRKLLGYALGRSVQLSDLPLIRTIRQRLEENEYRISEAVLAIVESPQFRQIRGRLAPDPSHN